MSDATKTIEFRKPVIIGGGDKAKTYQSIEIREPLAGQYEEAERQAASYGFDVALTALVAGVPFEVVDRAGISVPAEALRFIDRLIDRAAPSPASDEDWSMDLRVPIELKDQDGTVQMSHASLNLSEPTNQQRRKATTGTGPHAGAIALLAAVTGIRRGALRKLPAGEYLRAVEYLNGFQGRRQEPEPD